MCGVQQLDLRGESFSQVLAGEVGGVGGVGEVGEVGEAGEVGGEFVLVGYLWQVGLACWVRSSSQLNEVWLKAVKQRY